MVCGPSLNGWLAGTLLGLALANPTVLAAPCEPTFDHAHSGWQAILERRVKDGEVDYTGLQARDRPALEAYLASLAAVCPRSYQSWSEPQKLAFWINAYNAFTVALILDHYPLSSIRSIGWLPGAAFREAFITLPFQSDGPLSLNDLEHQILRKSFAEPRIHFAIVCASKSCPALRGEAYRASALESQLASAARGFLADPSKNRFDRDQRRLHLSSIFRWFEEDFVRAAGSVPAFVGRWAAQDLADAIKEGPLQIDYLDYDWSLNGR